MLAPALWEECSYNLRCTSGGVWIQTQSCWLQTHTCNQGSGLLAKCGCLHSKGFIPQGSPSHNEMKPNRHCSLFFFCSPVHRLPGNQHVTSDGCGEFALSTAWLVSFPWYGNPPEAHVGGVPGQDPWLGRPPLSLSLHLSVLTCQHHGKFWSKLKSPGLLRISDCLV